MKKSVTVVGKIKGKISKKSGKNGFGYDPIFYPIIKKLLLDKCLNQKKCRLTIDLLHLQN